MHYKFKVVKGFWSVDHDEHTGNLFAHKGYSYLPFPLKLQRSTKVDLEVWFLGVSSQGNALFSFRRFRWVILGKDLKLKELEQKKWSTGFLWYRVQMVSEFLGYQSLQMKAKAFSIYR